MKRREFMVWVGFGTLASSLPVAIAACLSPSQAAPSPATPSRPPGVSPDRRLAATPRSDGFVAIGTVAQLNQSGAIINKDFAPNGVAVIRDPANAANLIAVSAACPHRGCTVRWNGSQSRFACPCHGSQFQPNGAVAKGPANKPLATYAAKIEGDQVLVKVS
ncbi:QcrA and Rieske domain-containing protein [Trichothermofontia sp.]